MQHRRHADHYSRRAQKEGLAARSVYKLEEINKRWQILKPRQQVLDLGCAPGSWLQYSAKCVGEKGMVWGFDLQPLKIALPVNTKVAVADVNTLHFDECFDVVLSDMAPNTMGDHGVDALRSAVLVEQALEIAQRYLRKNGHVVVKVLEGREVPQLIKTMRGNYQKVEAFRPKATRKVSTEIFLIGLHKLLDPGGNAAESPRSIHARGYL